MITSTHWSGKKYAVLGLARSGKATAEALLASGAECLVWDDRAELREAFAGRAVIADPLDADLTGYAGVVVSPGVPLNTHPIAGHAAKHNVPVIGDIELFAQARSELPPHKVVGITGTNGKSTTTALVHHILQTAGLPSRMGGNIGLPILGQEPLPEGGIYVLELSSYQIDLTFSLDCDVAVLLNVTPDHLDRYDGFEAYLFAKARLFAMQSEQSAAIIDGDDEIRSRIGDLHFYGALQFRAQSGFSVPVPSRQSLSPSLAGPHNRSNASNAMLVAELLCLNEKVTLSALKSFSGLPHRMERVAEIDCVSYINDSKATNVAAAAPALAVFNRRKGVHWILGGIAKESGLGECEAELGYVKAAYTIGKSGADFAALLEGRVPVNQCETLELAVSSAAKAATPGDTVLLSPAAASFDQFSDFEARGQAFKDAVAALQERPAA
jgi:UDP-N-acetylmuramoylalanine--D-glutamate ligase